MAEVHAVTGPFSYTGRYIADGLIQRGRAVRGFVRRTPDGNPDMDCRPLQFSDPDRLVADLDGVLVLYNTYWIRFERRGMTFRQAVDNSRLLARAAGRAGVRRIVHLSVSNPSPTSPFAYFRGKAQAEEAVRSAGVPSSIIRPTLVFGREDILLNNIAWLLRTLHVFVLPGSGRYRVQPVFVGDVAKLAMAEAQAQGNRVLDAAGPEILTFRQVVEMLAKMVEARAVAVPAPAPLALAAGRMVSLSLRDTVITGEEIGALMAETLVSGSAPTCSTKITEWLAENGRRLGQVYASELQRHWQSH